MRCRRQCGRKSSPDSSLCQPCRERATFKRHDRCAESPDKRQGGSGRDFRDRWNEGGGGGRRQPFFRAIKKKNLFGSLPLFRPLHIWSAWFVWLKGVFPLPMTADELDTFYKCTGRVGPPPNGAKEVYTI